MHNGFPINFSHTLEKEGHCSKYLIEYKLVISIISTFSLKKVLNFSVKLIKSLLNSKEINFLLENNFSKVSSKLISFVNSTISKIKIFFPSKSLNCIIAVFVFIFIFSYFFNSIIIFPNIQIHFLFS